MICFVTGMVAGAWVAVTALPSPDWLWVATTVGLMIDALVVCTWPK